MRRRGLSLVEVVLVLLLFLVGLGILLPKLAPAPRGPSSRTYTNNNLKQCALAVHNFHDIYRRLPGAFDRDGHPLKKDPTSLWFQLLPFVEADVVYRADRHDAVVSAFNAPSDTFAGDFAGRLNFAANLRVFAHDSLGPQSCDTPGTPLVLPADGAVMAAKLTLPRIADGTSNVLMLATRSADCDGKATRYAAHPADHGGYFGAGTHSKPASPAHDDEDLVFQILARQGRRSSAPCNPTPGLYGHSFHANGLSTALMDGTVKNVAVTMSPETFMRALCPGDNQALGKDWVED